MATLLKDTNILLCQKKIDYNLMQERNILETIT